MSLCARVLSIVINGVEQAVTGGSLRHSRGDKSEDSALNAINKSVSFDLPFPYCFTWLWCLVEIVGNCFFYNLVVGFSTYQTSCYPFIALWMGCNVRFCNPSVTVVIMGGGSCVINLMTVAWECRRD